MHTLSNSIKNVLIRIHKEVYTQINEKYIDIFLCGGMSKGLHKSDRDKIRYNFANNDRFRIMYPEELFIDILNRDRQADLLSLEKFLADNCDIIAITCESAGSLVELGAFVNHDETEKKVIALIDQSHKKDKSFIMLGPIRMLLKKGKYNVIFYNPKEIKTLVQNLIKYSKSKNIENSNSPYTKKGINSMVGLYYFIPILLFFFNEIDSEDLVNYIRFLFQNNNYDEKNFDRLFRASLKLLYREKSIFKMNTTYRLTENGYDIIRNIMKNAKIQRKSSLYDNIRFCIMDQKYG